MGAPTVTKLCKICHGEGWVCENHPNSGWQGGDAKCCDQEKINRGIEPDGCGAGALCICNTSNPPWHHKAPWEEENLSKSNWFGEYP